MANIPQDFLFRFRFPCRRFDSAILTEAFSGETLDERFRLPLWTQNETSEKFAQNPRLPRTSTPRSPKNENRFDFRVGWAPEGFVFTAVVRGKRRFVRRSQTDLNGADCVRLCLDVRDVKEARRAGKYCFKFLFYPRVGESDDGAKPLVQQAPINRAKAPAPSIDVDEFRTATDVRADGYAFSAFLPTSARAGFEPTEFPRLGFHFSVRDDEFGAFDLQHSALFPVEEDPSLWATLDFVE